MGTRMDFMGFGFLGMKESNVWSKIWPVWEKGVEE